MATIGNSRIWTIDHVMRLCRNQNPELAESGSGVELTLITVDLQFTEIVENSFPRNSPYHVGTESRIERFRRGDAVDIDFDLADVTVALHFTAAGGRKNYFDLIGERKRHHIQIDCGNCQNQK